MKEGTDSATVTPTGFSAGSGNTLTNTGLTASKADIAGQLTVGAVGNQTTVSGNTITTGTVNASALSLGTGNTWGSSGITATAATINGTLSATQVNVGDITIGGTGNTISSFTSGTIASNDTNAVTGKAVADYLAAN